MKHSIAKITGKTIFLILALWLTGSDSLTARTFFLATDGDDSATCKTGAEFRTLKRAVACLAPGDTLIIREGVFEGGVEITVSAPEQALVLIQGESLKAVISGSGDKIDAIRIQSSPYVTLDRLTVREAERAGAGVRHSNHVRITNCRFADNGKWGIFTSFADDIHFEGNECYGSRREHGIYHSNSGDRFIIRNNLVHHNRGNGIHLNGDPEIPGGDGVLNQGVVEGNIIYGNGTGGGAAINMTHVHDILVRNNLIYKNYAGGITVYQDAGTFEQGSKRVLIMGNTVYYEPGKGRSGVNVQTTSEKVVIAGNIFVSGGRRGTIEVNSDHLSTIVSDCNILWGVGSDSLIERKDKLLSFEAWRKLSDNGYHSRYADPLFTDIDSGNFEPLPGSPVIDTGMSFDSVKSILDRLEGCQWLLARLDSLPDVDIRNSKRPEGAAPDAGAYEINE